MSIADDILTDLGKPPKKQDPAPDDKDKKADDKKPDDKKADDKKPDTLPPPPVIEITDDLLLGELNKRGFKLEKMDQLSVKGPTDDERAAEIKKKKDAAFSYAIDKGVYTKEDYVSYEKDRDRPASEIAFDLFKKDFIEGIKGTAEEGTFKDDDIRELFDERNFSTEKDDSPKKKFINTRLENIKDSYLKNKYGKILTAENVYSDYEQEVARATQYKGIVDNAIGKIPAKLKYNVAGVDVEFTPSVEALQHVKDVYLHPQAYTAFGKDATEEGLKQAFELTIAQKDLPRLLQEAAETYHQSKLKTLKLGRIGVPPTRLDGTSNADNAPDSKTLNADKLLEETKKK